MQHVFVFFIYLAPLITARITPIREDDPNWIIDDEPRSRSCKPPNPLITPRYNIRSTWNNKVNGKIFIYWTVSINFPPEILPTVRKAMQMLEEDVGCMTLSEMTHDMLPHADMFGTGVVFVYENEMKAGHTGCYSVMGHYPTAFLKHALPSALVGIPYFFQLISLADSCHGRTVQTVQHEFIHALGWDHEHQVSKLTREDPISPIMDISPISLSRQLSTFRQQAFPFVNLAKLKTWRDSGLGEIEKHGEM